MTTMELHARPRFGHVIREQGRHTRIDDRIVMTFAAHEIANDLHVGLAVVAVARVA